jgi:hypothetical protein
MLRHLALPELVQLQLLQWQKRRHAALDASRLYRLAPQSVAAPQYLVAKAVTSPAGAASLDARGAFVLQAPGVLFVWAGEACPEAFVDAARRFAAQLQRYEGAAEAALLVRQGHEPATFWASLAAASAACEGSSSRAGSPAVAGQRLLAGQRVAGGAAAWAVGQNSSYDRDFEASCLVCC